MVFSSYVFICVFLPATLLGYWICTHISHQASKWWLCLASLVFYAWWDIRWLPVILVSILFNFVIGRAIIARTQQDKTSGALLAFGVAVNLAALAYYKYMFWLLGLVGLGAAMPVAIGLPLGISFFTFTQIAFLVDASEEFHGRYSPTNYVLFVTFFPHLIAGPIVHHRDLMPQFEESRNYRLHAREIAIGLAIFVIGLAKKTVIADNVATVSARMLDHPGSVSAVWLGVLAYSMQLYFDFSGYSDMAVGLGRMFGIKFPVNFNSPYKATSIIDFWQRWHITLTRFLTAYVYNPIALALVRSRARAGISTSKRASRSPRGFLVLIAVPTWITIVLAGIWHGAGLQYVAYGVLHAVYLTINHAWRTFGPKSVADPGPIARVARTIGYGVLVYMGVLVAQIAFHARSLADGITTVALMLHLERIEAPYVPIALADMCLVAAAMAIAWFAPNTWQLMASHDPALETAERIAPSRLRIQFTLGWAMLLGVMLFAGLFNIQGEQPFIYFQF
jgi:D-alanyl-lipoteichoic acid acyltransferase DltB (MBOAT superfamily)